ncbi:hypothetical protein C9994_03285 [Marivirga lumbricoides]|uniref:Uncharacterized protein n=1 Tax=Marivirga lumbricoides TaxID=1046115 RepID=A0A2T4DU89_9BACT|nr:hypothetical protein C9994_03285 [Marivirga lumbricoides]
MTIIACFCGVDKHLVLAYLGLFFPLVCGLLSSKKGKVCEPQTLVLNLDGKKNANQLVIARYEAILVIKCHLKSNDYCERRAAIFLSQVLCAIR